MVSQAFLDIVFTLCEDLNTPRSVAVCCLLRNNEWGQLLALRADPVDYLDHASYFKDAICTDILRKCKGLVSEKTARDAAVAGFYDAEQQCKAANLRLNKYLHNGPFSSKEIRIANIFDDVKRFISSVLGRVPPDLDFKFGPGSTFSDKPNAATVLDKMAHSPQITSDAMCLIPLWERTAWYRAVMADVDQSAFDVIRGNRFSTVPKDSLKDRGIAVEPSFNVAAQLAIGACLKTRIKSAGLDLLKAELKHGQVARESSLDGAFATIDLSAASDTVCTTIVELFLSNSPEWLSLLQCCRSPFTLIQGKWCHLEKFSSMGNGFTFELETLIFLALGHVVMQHAGHVPIVGENLLVYGDDIIIPTDCAREMLAILAYCGFTANPKKTFISGRFKESCGSDFFDGHPVRPFYIKDVPSCPADWIGIANGIRFLAKRYYGPDFLGLFSRSWFKILDQIPTAIRRCRGPELLGNLVIHDSPSRWSHCWRGQKRYFRVWRPVQKKVSLRHWSSFPTVQLAAALYGVDSGGVSRRNSVTGYRFGRVLLTCLGD